MKFLYQLPPKCFTKPLFISCIIFKKFALQVIKSNTKCRLVLSFAKSLKLHYLFHREVYSTEFKEYEISSVKETLSRWVSRRIISKGRVPEHNNTRGSDLYSECLQQFHLFMHRAKVNSINPSLTPYYTKSATPFFLDNMSVPLTFLRPPQRTPKQA